MRNWYLIVSASFILIVNASSAVHSSPQAACTQSDSICQEFARLMQAERYEEIVAKADPRKSYSRESRAHIGQAYLMMAGRDQNSPEQEEMYCRKALEYGATAAYMGLYFIHAEKEPEAALGYLQNYVETKPNDSVPYVILGESELTKRNYDAARQYFVEARRVSHGLSANLDWLLFQASYLSGDFATASSMLESALSEGKTKDDLQALIDADRRYTEIGTRKEFRRFFPDGSEAVHSPSPSRT